MIVLVAFHRFVAPLVLAALCVGPVAGQAGDCLGGEVYDIEWSSVQKIKAPTLDSCGSSTVEVVQLFTPPRLPWNYTQACYKVLFGETGQVALNSPQQITLVAYEDAGGHPASSPEWSSVLQVSALVPLSGSIPWRWYNSFMGYVARRPSVFLGFRLASDCKQASYYASVQLSGRLSHWRSGPGATWSVHRADWTHDNFTALLFRAKGVALDPLAHLPAGWSCSPAAYSDRRACDCECGAFDPDCANASIGSAAAQCTAAGEACNSSGHCVQTGWDTRVLGCQPRSFGSRDGCQCGCGSVVDPDCFTSTAAGTWRTPALNCNGTSVSMCDNQGQCAGAWATPQCPASALGDGVVCNCGCQATGVMDPDCLVDGLPSDCGENGHCFEGACRAYPAAWRCNPMSLGSGDGCNCSCGSVDPDCAVQTGVMSPIGTTVLPNAGTATSFLRSSAMLDAGEECEDGTGCSANCSCVGGYTSTSPPTRSCVAIPGSDDRIAGGGQDKTAIIVATPIAAVGFLAFMGSIVGVVVVKRKHRARATTNIPIDISSIGFVPASMEPPAYTTDVSTSAALNTAITMPPVPSCGPPEVDSSGQTSDRSGASSGSLVNVVVGAELPTYPLTPQQGALPPEPSPRLDMQSTFVLRLPSIPVSVVPASPRPADHSAAEVVQLPIALAIKGFDVETLRRDLSPPVHQCQSRQQPLLFRSVHLQYRFFLMKSGVIVSAIVALAALCVAAAAQAGDCVGGEVYDAEWSSVQKIKAPVLDSCGSSAVEAVQLFMPPRLPWNYTQACYKVLFGEVGQVVLGAPVEITLVAYDDVGGVPAGTAHWSSTVQVSALVPPFGAIPWRWYNSFMGYVARRPSVFLGFRVASDCKQASYYASVQLSGRLSHWRSGPGATWSVHRADWTHDNFTALLFRAKGVALDPLAHLPAGWSCSPAAYSDRRACDCECGAFDPDCANASIGSAAAQCTAAGEACNSSGHCVQTGWDTRVLGCQPRSFGSRDGCQCGCGSVVDPDCFTSTAAGTWRPPALNCNGTSVSMCDNQGQCAGAWATPQCPASALGDGVVCNCGCQATGVMDPDCLVDGLPSDCGENGHCFEGACRAYPAAWRCNPMSLGSGDGCNCSCGSVDPDCAVQTGVMSPIGCPAGIVKYSSSSPVSINCVPKCGDGMVVPEEQCDGGVFCTQHCTCIPGHEPLSPRKPFCSGCGNDQVDAGEECDGGSGCTLNCTCAGGFEHTVPVTRGCQVSDTSSPNEGGGNAGPRIDVIVGCTTAFGGASIIGAAVCLSVVCSRKHSARRANIPIDIDSIGFVPTSEVPPSDPVVDISAAAAASMHVPCIIPPGGKFEMESPREVSERSGASSGSLANVVVGVEMPTYPQVEAPADSQTHFELYGSLVVAPPSSSSGDRGGAEPPVLQLPQLSITGFNVSPDSSTGVDVAAAGSAGPAPASAAGSVGSEGQSPQ
eukprot:m51a1_g5934 putative serine-threonine protein (1453) ;mRNA; r:92638-98368